MAKNLPQKEEIKLAVLEVQMQAMTKSVEGLGGKIDALTTKIDDSYVKKEDFKPVKDEVDNLKYLNAKIIGYATGAAALLEIVLRVVFKT